MQGLGLNTIAARNPGLSFSRVPTDYLPRPRLIESLSERKRLRLLCAPAGYGKTAVLSQFMESRACGEQQLWIDCRGQPQALASLCTLVAQALGLAPDTSPEALLECLGARMAPFWLVLDDLASDNSSELNGWIEQLLAVRNSSVQLLVSCRQRPDWNLPRLVLEGELLELNTAQLALTRDEFEALVNQLRHKTNARCREALWAETQGWCAGVRLLLSRSINSVTPHFSSAPVLRDYLHYELLARLDADEREVLFGLAHLSKVCVELCDQLWEEQRGGQVFERLLRCQAFIVPVDSQARWYRLLPAVAHALQDQLHAATLNRLRLRSCRLLSSLGHFDDAIEQALSAEQPEVAASYMEQLRLTWLLSDRHLDRLMIWRDRLPAYLLESSPRLIYLCARALLFSGRLDEAEHCLQQLRQFLPMPDPSRNHRLLANWQALFGSLQALRGNTRQARLHCQAAREGLNAQDWLSVLLCLSTLARIAMIEGDLPESRKLLEEAVELARRQGSRDAEVLVNTDRIRLTMLEGQAGMAEALLDKELEYVTGNTGQPNPLLGRLLFLKGELLLLQGSEHAAEQALQSGLVQVRDCSAPFILFGYLMLSELAARRGRYEDAQLLLHEAQRRMHWGKIHAACYSSAIALQNARILAQEQRWEPLLQATQALDAYLQGPTASSPPLLMPSLRQRNQLLLAQATYQTGEVDLAVRRLRTLLVECEQVGFITLASEARQCLIRIAGDTEQPAHVEADSGAQARAPASQGTSYQDELTPREVSVLKLLAEGMSVREVGKSLFISVNTVKTHAKNINVKLGACRRTQAINSAKSMGILA